MESKTTTGGLKEFKDSGGSAPLSKEDAKKIDDAYARSSGYKNHADYLEHKDDPISLGTWLIILGVLGFAGIGLYLGAIFIWNLIAPIIGA